jgi:hypothetical protein
MDDRCSKIEDRGLKIEVLQGNDPSLILILHLCGVMNGLRL